MSYRSSFSQYGGGRASPYATPAPRLSQQDRSFSDLYEYVDPADGGQRGYDTYVSAIPIEEDDAPDVIHVKYMGKAYKLEFPAYSISESGVTVQEVRRRMAEVLQQDPRRVRLIYKDRELRYDSYPVKKYRLKQNSEIAVVVSEQLNDYSHTDNAPSSGEESGSASSLRAPVDHKRHRANSSVRHRTHHERKPSAGASNGFLSPSQSLRGRRPSGAPSSELLQPSYSSRTERPISDGRQHMSPRLKQETPPKQFDWPSSPKPAASPKVVSRRPAADPNSPMGKVQALQDLYYDTWLPESNQFLSAPPSDAAQRQKEYARLSESVMRHVIEAADAIELQGDQDARTERKRVLGDAQELLRRLDTVGKPK